MKRSELLTILNKVKPGLANKELVEQSTDFVFKNKKVYTYNDEIAVSYPIDLNFEGAVPAMELYQMINKIKDEDIEINISENEIVFKGKKFQAGIRLESDIVLPLDDIQAPTIWKSVPKKLVEIISFCSFSVGKDMSRPALTCIHLTNSYIESCDNFRFTRYVLKSNFDNILLPNKAASKLTKYVFTAYGRTDGFIHFKNDEDLIFSCRIFEDEYPDVAQILNKSDEGEKIRFLPSTTEILERVETMAEQDLTGDRKVSVEILNGKIKIRGENNIGWFEETNKVRCKTNLVFDINPKFLTEILTHTTNAKISNDKTKLRFDDEKFIHVMAITTNE